MSAQQARDALLAEAAALFRTYEASHLVRGPEHAEKAERNAEIAGRIESALASLPAEAQGDGAVAQVVLIDGHAANIPRNRMVTWYEDVPNEGTLLYTRASPPAVKVPDGWKLVPVEPTPEMRHEGACARMMSRDVGFIWKRMLSAAPTVSAQKGEG